MISVIIPAYNPGDTLGACLDALLAQSAPRSDYEIIVVDDGSTDTTRALAQSRGVRVISQPNRGAAAARNLGAAQASGDVLLFLDADSVPDARWVERMAAPFADPQIAGASGEKKTRQRELWARLVQTEYDYKYDRLASSPRMDFVDSSTAGYRKDIFLSSGGFDSSLLEAEDTDLSYRLTERGCRMLLVRDALVYHTHPVRPVDYIRRKFQYARWRTVVYSRYPHKAASDTRTPLTQKLQAVFAFALIPIILASFVWSMLVWAAAALVVLFLATTIPFAAYCWRRSRPVGLIAPVALLGAAYAGALGALWGLFTRPAQTRSDMHQGGLG